MKKITFLIILLASITNAQTDTRIYDIVNNVKTERIKKDITKLANFGTRHTLSDTISNTRGIGAARRWIKSEFDKISKNCGDCLNVQYQKDFVKKNKRLTNKYPKFEDEYTLRENISDEMKQEMNILMKDGVGFVK